jgi:hypothetical protein
VVILGTTPAPKGRALHTKQCLHVMDVGIMLANHASTYKLRFGVEVITRVGQFSYFLRESRVLVLLRIKTELIQFLNFILFVQNWIPWSSFRLSSNRWFFK